MRPQAASSLRLARRRKFSLPKIMSRLNGGLKELERYEVWIIGAIVVSFFVKTVVLALSVSHGLPPDESTHMGIILLYAEKPLFIDNSVRSYPLGLVTHTPYLYHFLMGNLLKLNFIAASPYLFLRMINCLISLLTVYLSHRLACVFTQNPAIKILFLIMLTNTLMFTFLSSAVNYDNMVNLFCVISLYSLFSFFREGRIYMLTVFLISTLAGSLTKTAFLPFAVLLVAVYFLERRKATASDLKDLWSCLYSYRVSSVLLGAVLMTLISANFMLYGMNIISFGKLVPDCGQVLEVGKCVKYHNFAKHEIHASFKKGETTFAEALIAAKEIKSPGDRQDTVRLLEMERRYKKNKPVAVGTLAYSFLYYNRLKQTIFGVMAHKSLIKSRNQLLPFDLLFLLGLLLWVRNIVIGGSSRHYNYLTLVFALYFLFLMFFVHYRGYLETHSLFWGVQGRYLFPVIFPAYLILARSILSPFTRPVQAVLVVVIGAFFIIGDFPFFMLNATVDWFQ